MKRLQESQDIFNIPATTAANTTYTRYIDVRNAQDGSIQINWTAGAGGGTLSYIVEASTIEAKNELDAESKDVGDVFQDIGLLLLGATELTGDSFITDSAGIIGRMTWLKFEATVANRDNATALASRINLCY